MNALASGTAAIPPRLGELGVHRDRLVKALLSYRLSLWDRDEAAIGAKVGATASAHVDAHVDAASERARARERIRAVQSVKARRRRQKLGALGGRWLP